MGWRCILPTALRCYTVTTYLASGVDGSGMGTLTDREAPCGKTGVPPSLMIHTYFGFGWAYTIDWLHGTPGFVILFKEALLRPVHSVLVAN